MLYQIKGGERSHVGPITRIKDMGKFYLRIYECTIQQNLIILTLYFITEKHKMSKFISRIMLTFIINAYILAMKMMIIYKKTTKSVCITFIEMRDADEQ